MLKNFPRFFCSLVLVTFLNKINAEPPISLSKSSEEAFTLAKLANMLVTSYQQSRFQTNNIHINNDVPLRSSSGVRNSIQEVVPASQLINFSVDQNQTEINLESNRQLQSQDFEKFLSNPTGYNKGLTQTANATRSRSVKSSSPDISYFALVPINDIRSGPNQEYIRALSSSIQSGPQFGNGDRPLVAQSSGIQNTIGGRNAPVIPLVAVISPAGPFNLGIAEPVRDAEQFEFPYIVDVRRNCRETRHKCGGSIWNRNYIVTAAHCFFDGDGRRENSKYVIVAGEYEVGFDDGTEQTIQAKNIYMHPNYEGGKVSQGFDIAVVELSKSLDFTECEVEAGIFDDVGDALTAKIAGWGTIPGSGAQSVLQAGEIDIYDYYEDDCRKRFHGRADAASVVCGLRKDDNSITDACEGDSGGPLECDDGDGSVYICGLVSYGQGCRERVVNGSEDGKKLGVYTKIAFYQDFIERIAGTNDDEGVVGENCYEDYDEGDKNFLRKTPRPQRNKRRKSRKRVANNRNVVKASVGGYP